MPATFERKAPAIVARLMDEFNLADWRAAAMVGNLGHESCGFMKLQEMRPTVKGSRGGYGWAQWTGPRRRAFEAWVAAHGLKASSDEANLGFLLVELRGDYKRAVTAVRRAQDIAAAVKAFEVVYEGAGVKHYPSRIAYARRALAAYQAAAAPMTIASEEEPPAGFFARSRAWIAERFSLKRRADRTVKGAVGVAAAGAAAEGSGPMTALNWIGEKSGELREAVEPLVSAATIFSTLFTVLAIVALIYALWAPKKDDAE